MRPAQKRRIIFVTGTDTGAGKTLLTSLLLSHLRQTGARALAIKPFCSGGRADAELLHALQNGDLSLDEINPFHFSDPIAPLVAARRQHRRIKFEDVLAHIHSVTACLAKIENRKSRIENPALLIEGAGGLLAPLGEPKSHSRITHHASRAYTALDLICALNCRVIIVAPNRLGVINHTLLSVNALQASKSHEIKVILMDIDDHVSSRNTHRATRSPSPITHHASLPAIRSNPSTLTELLSPIPLFHVPNLGKNPSKLGLIEPLAKKYKKTLAQILA